MPAARTGVYQGYLVPILGELSVGEPEPREVKLGFEALLEHVGCGDNLSQLAREIVDQVPTTREDIDESDRMAYLHFWLRFAQSDSNQARMRWSYLRASRAVEDRDAFALRLWQQVDAPDPADPVAPVFQEHVTSRWCDWDYYRRHFFGWFLSRFDLRSARAVYAGSRWARGLDFLFCLAALVIAFVTFVFSFDLDVGLGVLGGAVVFVLAVGGLWQRSSRGLPLFAFFHSLIPRLGAAVGIGYLFLFSAPHLMEILSKSERNAWFFGGLSAALLVGAWLYIALHISRRVHPQLPAPLLFRRSASILALAVAYTALELLVAGPILFSNLMIDGAEGATAPQPPVDRLIFSAAVALSLGVILQLAWDEKPLTEPL